MKSFGLQGQGWYGTHDIHLPLTFNTAGVAFSEDVIINGRNAHRIGDISEEHYIPIVPPSPPHPETIVGEAGTVYINGKPAARLGAQITNGNAVLYLGSYSVFFT
jgi:uncharacterized Zn-binding protein involved in type VI secretion